MSKSVSILDFGAVSDGTLQTAAIQAAIDDCFLAGGGTVTVPAGEFLTGGIRLRSHVTLYLQSGAKLIGSRDPADYFAWQKDTIEPFPDEVRTDVHWNPAFTGRDISFLIKAGSSWSNGLIRAFRAEQIAVIGEPGSLIDGRDPYDETGEEHFRGPHGMNFHECKGVTLRGYTIQNTGNWAHSIFYTEDIKADHVTVIAGHDGFHFSSCDRISITDCDLATGDDCIAGFDNNNVYVDHCELNTACSAFRFGGNKVLVENCHIYGPAKYLFRGSLSVQEKIDGAHVGNNGRYNMLSIFTYYSDFSLTVRRTPGEILFRNCQVENTTRFIHFNFSGNEPWQNNRPLSSARFENITVDGASMPIHCYGSPDEPATIELDHVTIRLKDGYEWQEFFKIANLDCLRLTDVTVENLPTDRQVFASWGGVKKIELSGFNLGNDPEALLTERTDPFECNPI